MVKLKRLCEIPTEASMCHNQAAATFNGISCTPPFFSVVVVVVVQTNNSSQTIACLCCWSGGSTVTCQNRYSGLQPRLTAVGGREAFFSFFFLVSITSDLESKWSAIRTVIEIHHRLTAPAAC